MKTTYLAASLIGGLLAASSVPAGEPGESVALLKQIQGSVLINTGNTYQSATEGMDLFAGDRLMSMEHSSMVLVFRDGCVSQVGENQIITLEKSSTCEGGAAYVEEKWPQEADPMVAETRRPAQGAYGYSYGYEGPSRYSTAALVGGGALLLGTGYYIGNQNSKDDTPISGQ